MAVQGSQVVVAAYNETTYNTPPGTPDGRKITFSECSLAASRSTIQSDTISADRSRARPGAGNLDVSGSLKLEAAPESVGFWLKHAINGTPTTVGASAPYTHTFRPGALAPGFIIEKDWSSAIANKIERFTGCRIGDLTIDIPQEGFVTLSASANGADYVIGSSALDATLTDPGHTAWSGSEATIKIDGTASLLVKSGSIKVNNNLATDRYTIGAGGKRYDMPEGFCDASGSLTVIFESFALVEKALARTEATLEFILTHGTGAGTAGNEQLSIKLDHADIALASPPISSPGGVELSLEFTGFRSGSTDKGLVLVLKNAVSAALL